MQKMSSNKVDEITVGNILLNLPHVVKARRAKLQPLTTEADIEEFFVKYENSNAITVKDVFKDGKLDELVGSYCIHSIPLGHLNRAAQALFDFVTNNPEPVEPEINLFDREKRRVLGFVHHILEGYYIPNAFDYVIEHREYYISTWLDVHAKVADISYLPTKYSPEVQQYMFAHLREKHPEIYQGIPEKVRQIYENRYIIKKPKQTIRKAISTRNFTQSKKSVTTTIAMSTTGTSNASSGFKDQQKQTPGTSQSSAAVIGLSSQMDDTSDPSNEDSPSDTGEIVDEPQKRTPETSQKRALNRKKSLNNARKRIANKKAPPTKRRKNPNPKVQSIKANKALVEELSNYYALALTMFFYEDSKATLDKKPCYLVIMVHFLDRTKVSTDYTVKTCLLSFYRVPNRENKKFIKKLFDQTVLNYDLSKHYLVVVTELSLKMYFESVYRGEHKYSWLQCNWEVLVNSVLKRKETDENVSSLPNDPTPSTSDVITTSAFQENIDDLNKMINSITKKRDFLSKTNKTTKQLLYDLSGNHLLTVWFLLRKHLEYSDKSLSERLDKLFSDNVYSLHRVQLVAVFLNPCDFKNWMNPILAGKHKISSNDKDLIYLELIHFNKHIAKIDNIDYTMPRMDSYYNEDNNNDDDDDSDTDDEVNESSLELPIKRQKRLQCEVRTYLRKDAANSSVRPMVEPPPNEIHFYTEEVKLVRNWDKISQFHFWESPLIHLPELKRAALFYLTVPATSQPSIQLLENTVKQLDSIKSLSNQRKLFCIINKDYLDEDEDDDDHHHHEEINEDSNLTCQNIAIRDSGEKKGTDKSNESVEVNESSMTNQESSAGYDESLEGVPDTSEVNHSTKTK